ncbi:hypothetical protein [Nonomuraea roseola]|uniref:DUF2182 domain-containing protein n=1 Tax=Nonomuraea roseola TaxID=46179 RepID=A0ABV5Q2B1_9ACTN
MRISPVIPTVASLLLAALWGLSVFAGWGLEAFCTDGESSAACATRLDVVSTVSGLFAVLAACLTVGAWLFPLRFWALMGGAVLSWLAAAGVLFFGGMLAQ